MARTSASGQYLSIANPSTFFPSGLTARCISFWVYMSSGNGGTILSAIGANNSFDVITGGDGNVYFQSGATPSVGAVTSPAPLNADDGQWVHVLAAEVNGAYKLWVAGTSYAGNIGALGGSGYNLTNGTWFDALGTLSSLIIGALNTSGQQQENVGYSEIAVFDLVPSQADITALASGTPANSTSLTSATQAGLVHYYKDDAGGATWVDSVNSAYNATNNGTTQFLVGGAPSSPPIVTSSVSGVALTPATNTAAGLSTRQFATVVNGTGSPSQAVTYSKTGPISSLTSGGLATFGPATSAAQAWSVTATSVQDPTKSQTISGTIPAVNITVSAAGGATTGADGSTLQLSAAGGVAPYAWAAIGGAATIGASSGLLTFPSSGSGTAIGTATDTQGAVGNYSIMYAAGEAISAITLSTLTPNQGQSVTASVSLLNLPSGVTVASYAWMLAGVSIGTNASSIVFNAASLQAAQPLQVTVTDSAGRTYTASATITTPAVAVGFASAVNCQVGGSVSIPAPVVTGAANTATTLTGSGAAYYTGGLFMPPSGAAAGNTYLLTETSVADPNKSATCIVTLTSLVTAQVFVRLTTGGLTTLNYQRYDPASGAAVDSAAQNVSVSEKAPALYSVPVLGNAGSVYNVTFANPTDPTEYTFDKITLPSAATASGPTAIQIRQEMDANSTQLAALVSALALCNGMAGVNQALLNPIVTSGVLTAYDLCIYDTPAHATLNDGATGLLHKLHVVLTYVGGVQNGQIVTQVS